MIVGTKDSMIAGLSEKHRFLQKLLVTVRHPFFLVVELQGKKVYFMYPAVFSSLEEEVQRVTSELGRARWTILSEAWITMYEDVVCQWKDPAAAALSYAVKNNVKPSLAVLLAQPTRSRRAR
jgi:hypothetical protein